jgi:predicted unusual protein kinase regulating ubiquinone biosynthesis (AarF/ABC1/UbiB family)
MDLWNKLNNQYSMSKLFTPSFLPKLEVPLELIQVPLQVPEEVGVNLQQESFTETLDRFSIHTFFLFQTIFPFFQIGWILFSEYVQFRFYSVLSLIPGFLLPTLLFSLFSHPSYPVSSYYQEMIRNIAIRLSKVNLLYVKLFQAVALNKEWLDQETNNELLGFTDNVPYEEKEIDYPLLSTIAKNYDLTLTSAFPTNAGMISIIFQATHNSTGKKYVIKMKRNGIDERLTNSINGILFLVKLITWLSSRISFFSFFEKYRILDVIVKNIDMIQQQTNFQEEVKNLLLIKNNCNYMKYVVIPEVYESVTSRYPSAILMECLDGKKITEVFKEDKVGFAKSVLKFGFVTGFIHGVTHGDLHCGNILFIKDETDSKYPHKIGVLDFGILCEFEESLRNSLFEFIGDLMERPVEESALKILESGIILNKKNEPLTIKKDLSEEKGQELIDITSQILHQVLRESGGANQYQLYRFLKDFDHYLSKNDLLGKECFTINDSYIKMQLVIAMAHGVTMKLCEKQYIELADEVIHELFHSSFLKAEVETELYRKLNS